MRIDKAENNRIGIEKFQLEVNKAAKFGRTLKQIQETADLTRFTIKRPGLEQVSCTVQVIIEPAHLGKGYVAFLKCPKCHIRVRSLYYIRLELGCRLCLHLTYKKQDRRQSIVNRLIWDDKLREKYLNSWRTKHIRMTMEAEWVREAIMEEGYKKGQEIIAKLKDS